MRLRKFHDDWHRLRVGDDTPGFSETITRQYAEWITDGSASLPGPVYGPDKFKLLKSADSFVLPTRSENFSIAVQEALAAKLPVVCTKGAPWSKIQEVGAGWWVDISTEGIELGLRNMMMATVEQRKVMGIRGHQYVLDDFGWRAIGEKQVSIYEQIVDLSNT